MALHHTHLCVNVDDGVYGAEKTLLLPLVVRRVRCCCFCAKV